LEKAMPQLALIGALLGALVTPLGLSTPAAADRSVVVTDKGAVRGSVTDAGRAFRRIPFAAPPVGELRWRAPGPAAPWTGVRDATVPGPECAQAGSPELHQPRVTNEDCLYLNVYAPASRIPYRPVMVWFHGGGFTAGSANPYDGSALAGRGVVVVTVNYRLGAFGFLAHPALSGEDRRVGSGNYGTLDQQAALRWVRANAAAFGGDPRRVTIFGESAGGVSVCAHLASPLTGGLFSRAIVQSGPCNLLPRTLPDAEAAGERFATAAGCQGQPDLRACLRARPAGVVLDAMGDSETWAPTTGTPVLPVDPGSAIASGAYHRVPTMAGSNLDEGTIFAALTEAGGVPLNAATYPAVLAGLYGADAPRVQGRYPGSAYGEDYRLALGAVLTDSLFACPTWDLNRSLSRSTRTYGYEFADRTAPNLYGVTPGFPLGAYHAAELTYLFRFQGLPLDPAQRRLSDQMLSYWTRFAAGGDPNGGPTPDWQPFRPAHPTVLTLDLRRADRGHLTNGYGFDTRHRCAFWATVGAANLRSLA
jgi:para-nitrobenzyl esterase